MPIDNFSQPQKQALIDLAMLAMSADGHLAAVEDECVHRLLEAVGFVTESEQNREYDASISRVRRHSETAGEARAQAVALARTFSNHEERRLVQRTLEDLITSDRHVSLQENSFMSLIRETLER